METTCEFVEYPVSLFGGPGSFENNRKQFLDEQDRVLEAMDEGGWRLVNAVSQTLAGNIHGMFLYFVKD